MAPHSFRYFRFINRCILGIGIFMAQTLNAQPFTKLYIMALHTCDRSVTSNCNDPINHTTRLLESEDGKTWTTLSGFTPLKGGGAIPPTSVPDIILRGTKAYLFTPGVVYVYDKTSEIWSSSKTVSISDQNGAKVQFVDPSAILDNNGNIILFFLNSTGSTGDPAGCPTYPCSKRFDSAIEVAGSDGTQFIMQAGPRAQITADGTIIRTASDPDIFFDGTQYIMYISAGTTTYAYSSTSMYGAYTPVAGLSNGLLTMAGGIACGYFDTKTKQYWTYVQSNAGGVPVIQRAVHSTLGKQLQPADFSTVISGAGLGLNAQTTTESPGFAVNSFLSTSLNSMNNPLTRMEVFPNPADELITVRYITPEAASLHYSLHSLQGKVLLRHKSHKQQVEQHTIDLSLTSIPAGVYFLRLEAAGTVISRVVHIIR